MIAFNWPTCVLSVEEAKLIRNRLPPKLTLDGNSHCFANTDFFLSSVMNRKFQFEDHKVERD